MLHKTFEFLSSLQLAKEQTCRLKRSPKCSMLDAGNHDVIALNGSCTEQAKDSTCCIENAIFAMQHLSRNTRQMSDVKAEDFLFWSTHVWKMVVRKLEIYTSAALR